MNDLPQRYTALVARRPELAVPSLFFEPSVMWGSWYRSNTGKPVNLHDTDARDDWRAIHTDEAYALIFRRLCESLPLGWVYGQCEGRSHPFGVFNMTGVGPECYVGPDPLSALFAFWEAQP